MITSAFKRPFNLHVQFEEPDPDDPVNKFTKSEICEWNMISRTQLEALANCGNDRTQLLTRLSSLVRTLGRYELAVDEPRERRTHDGQKDGGVIPERGITVDEERGAKKEFKKIPVAFTKSRTDEGDRHPEINEKTVELADSVELTKKRLENKHLKINSNLEELETNNIFASKTTKPSSGKATKTPRGHVHVFGKKRYERKTSVDYKADFVTHYLLAWYQYAISRSFTAGQTSAILEIAYKCHAYCVHSPPSSPATEPLRSPADVVEEFKQLMLSHSVMDVPRTIRVFTAQQCADAVEYFVRSYIKILPMVKMFYFPNAPLC